MSSDSIDTGDERGAKLFSVRVTHASVLKFSCLTIRSRPSGVSRHRLNRRIIAGMDEVIGRFR